MSEYHKIQTLFNRDPATSFKKVIPGEYARPEFEYLQHNKWEFTEKVDGTNIRVILTAAGVEFRGKTDAASIPPFLLTKLRELFLLFPDAYKTYFPETESVIIYGEGYGARIQKGGGNYIPDDVDFAVFDIRIGDYWLEHGNIEAITGELRLSIVPVLGDGDIFAGVHIVKKGFNSRWGEFPAEGIVARPLTQLFNRNGQRIIWKLKCRDF